MPALLPILACYLARHPAKHPCSTSRRVAGRISFKHTQQDSGCLAAHLIPACLNKAMIDLRKATKGRRMSKKRRRKSSKTSVGTPIRTAAKTPAKARSSKSRTSPASKSGGNATNRQTGSSLRGSSHKPESKALKSAAAKKPVRGATKAKASGFSTNSSDSSAAGRSNLVEGARAPEFSLQRDGGGTVSLSDCSGKKLVLFFYPRADTPGCTREAIDFTRLARDFAESQTVIVGVSADPRKAQEAFRDKHKLAVPLASDEQHQMLEAYGAWGEKSMYGRTFQGILRTTVLIGADGLVLKIWRHVKVDGHAEEVLAAARAA